MEYVFVGDSIEDGIFAWISIGINASVSETVNPAALWTANGGVASSSGGAGGPGGNNSTGAPGGPSGTNSTLRPQC
ncbi:hypothetical protein AeNC1_016508 [Aphanomyces euteiches]|nr:hypothetical protein AeNC1_016508 [Aphanomyces euteiches]